MIHVPPETWCPVSEAQAACSQPHAASAPLSVSALSRIEAVCLITRFKSIAGMFRWQIRHSLAMLTKDTPQPTLQHQPTRQRGTVTIMARQMTRFTRRQQTLEWSSYRILKQLFGAHITAWTLDTCQMSLSARAIEDSRLWLERSTSTRPAQAARTPRFLDNAHFTVTLLSLIDFNLIPATCSSEPDTLLQICGSGSE